MSFTGAAPILSEALPVRVCSNRDTLNSVAERLASGPLVLSSEGEWHLLRGELCSGFPGTRRVIDLPSVVLPSVSPKSSINEVLVILSRTDASYGLIAEGHRVLGLASRQKLDRDLSYRSHIQGTAHDLKNALNVLTMLADFIAEKQKQDDDVAMLRMMLSKVNSIVSSLASTQAQLSPLELKGFLSDSLRPLQRTCAMVIELQLGEPSAVWVSASRTSLHQVLTNLVFNAQQATRAGGSLTVTLYRELDWAILCFQDIGGGLPEDSLADIFDPLFSTRAGGSGLGLFQVKRIVEAHRGQIEARNTTKGAEFMIRLPILSRDV